MSVGPPHLQSDAPDSTVDRKLAPLEEPDIFSRHEFSVTYSAKDIDGDDWPAEGSPSGRTLAAVGSNATVDDVSSSDLDLEGLGEHTQYAVAADGTNGYRVQSGWTMGATTRVWVRTLTRRTGDLASGYYPYRYVNSGTRHFGWRVLHGSNATNRHEIRATTYETFTPSGGIMELDEWEIRDTVFEYTAGSGGVAVIKHLRNGADLGTDEGSASASDIGASGGFGVLGAVTGDSREDLQIVAVAVKWDDQPTLLEHRQDASDIGLYTFPCGDEVLDEFETCDDGNLLAGDGCSEACRIEQIYGLSATVVMGGVEVEWESTEETNITSFELYRGSTELVPTELVETIEPEGGPFSYEHTDEDGAEDHFYWLLARGNGGAVLAALGPVTPGGSPSPETCVFDAPYRCFDPEYFETECGRVEVRFFAGDEEWYCSDEFVAALEDSISGPLARQNVTLVQPKLIIDEEGQPEETFLELVQGTKVLYDSSQDVHLRYWVPGELSELEPPALTDAQATDLNGARVESCFEYGYQSVEDYANWVDYLQHNPMTGLEMVESIFDGPVAFVNVTGSGETLEVVFDGEDSDGEPLPETLLGTPLFFTSMARTALELWDPLESRPASDPVRIEETWTFHHERWAEAVLEGWSEDELEALRRELGVLTHLIFRYNELEFEAMRTVLEDEMRYSSAAVEDAWHLIDLRFEDQDLSENLHPLSCRWRRFEGLLGVAPGPIRPGWLRGEDVAHLGISQTEFDFFEQQRAFFLDAKDMGTDSDPMGGLPDMPSDPPARPLEDTNDYWLGPPPESECDEEDDPNDPLLEPPFTSSNYSPRYEFFTERLDHIRNVQYLIATQIEAQYALLEPLCDPIEKCMWAPSMLRRQLDRHFGGLRTALENRCIEETNDDFEDLNRLFTVTSTVNFEPTDAAALLVMQGTDYEATVNDMHGLFWDLIAFRDMVYRAAIVGLEKLVRHGYQRLPKDGDNRATTSHEHGFSTTRAGKYVAGKYRAQSRSGVDCSRDGEGNFVVDESILDPELLEEPEAWFVTLCKCGISIAEEEDLEGAIFEYLGEEEPLLSTFLGMASGAVDHESTIAVGYGLDINVTQGENFLRANLNAQVQAPVLVLPLTGPLALTLSVGGAMTISMRVEFDLGDRFADLCSTVNPTTRALSANARLKGGLDAVAAIAVEIPILFAAGVEGRLTVFDGARDWDVSIDLERITADNLCALRDPMTQECLQTGVDTPGDILEFFRGDLGCDPAAIGAYISGSDPDIDFETACPDILIFPNSSVIDRLIKVDDRLTHRSSVGLFGGSVSVFVRLFFIKLSFELVNWEGVRNVKNVATEAALLTNGRALCHESIDVFPDWVDQSLCWP